MRAAGNYINTILTQLRGKLLAGDGVQFHFDIGRRQRAAFQGAPQLVGGEAQRLRQLGALRDALHHRNQPGIEDQLHFLAVARLAKPLRPAGDSRKHRFGSGALFPISAGEHQDLCLLRWGFGPRHRGIDIGHRWLKFPQQRDGLPGLRQANGAHLAIDRLRLTGGRDLRQYLEGGLAVGEHTDDHLGIGHRLLRRGVQR